MTDQEQLWLDLMSENEIWPKIEGTQKDRLRLHTLLEKEDKVTPKERSERSQLIEKLEKLPENKKNKTLLARAERLSKAGLIRLRSLDTAMKPFTRFNDINAQAVAYKGCYRAFILATENTAEQDQTALDNVNTRHHALQKFIERDAFVQGEGYRNYAEYADHFLRVFQVSLFSELPIGVAKQLECYKEAYKALLDAKEDDLKQKLSIMDPIVVPLQAWSRLREEQGKEQIAYESEIKSRLGLSKAAVLPKEIIPLCQESLTLLVSGVVQLSGTRNKIDEQIAQYKALNKQGFLHPLVYVEMLRPFLSDEEESVLLTQEFPQPHENLPLTTVVNDYYNAYQLLLIAKDNTAHQNVLDEQKGKLNNILRQRMLVSLNEKNFLISPKPHKVEARLKEMLALRSDQALPSDLQRIFQNYSKNYAELLALSCTPSYLKTLHKIQALQQQQVALFTAVSQANPKMASRSLLRNGYLYLPKEAISSTVLAQLKQGIQFVCKNTSGEFTSKKQRTLNRKKYPFKKEGETAYKMYCEPYHMDYVRDGERSIQLVDADGLITAHEEDSAYPHSLTSEQMNDGLQRFSQQDVNIARCVSANLMQGGMPRFIAKYFHRLLTDQMGFVKDHVVKSIPEFQFFRVKKEQGLLRFECMLRCVVDPVQPKAIVTTQVKFNIKIQVINGLTHFEFDETSLNMDTLITNIAQDGKLNQDLNIRINPKTINLDYFQDHYISASAHEASIQAVEAKQPLQKGHLTSLQNADPYFIQWTKDLRANKMSPTIAAKKLLTWSRTELGLKVEKTCAQRSEKTLSIIACQMLVDVINSRHVVRLESPKEIGYLYRAIYSGDVPLDQLLGLPGIEFVPDLPSLLVHAALEGGHQRASLIKLLSGKLARHVQEVFDYALTEGDLNKAFVHKFSEITGSQIIDRVKQYKQSASLEWVGEARVKDLAIDILKTGFWRRLTGRDLSHKFSAADLKNHILNHSEHPEIIDYVFGEKKGFFATDYKKLFNDAPEYLFDLLLTLEDERYDQVRQLVLADKMLLQKLNELSSSEEFRQLCIKDEQFLGKFCEAGGSIDSQVRESNVTILAGLPTIPVSPSPNKSGLVEQESKKEVQTTEVQITKAQTTAAQTTKPRI